MEDNKKMERIKYETGKDGEIDEIVKEGQIIREDKRHASASDHPDPTC